VHGMDQGVHMLFGVKCIASKAEKMAASSQAVSPDGYGVVEFFVLPLNFSLPSEWRIEWTSACYNQSICAL
jgi:hypothetical protein